MNHCPVLLVLSARYGLTCFHACLARRQRGRFCAAVVQSVQLCGDRCFAEMLIELSLSLPLVFAHGRRHRIARLPLPINMYRPTHTRSLDRQTALVRKCAALDRFLSPLCRPRGPPPPLRDVGDHHMQIAGDGTSSSHRFCPGHAHLDAGFRTTVIHPDPDSPSSDEMPMRFMRYSEA